MSLNDSFILTKKEEAYRPPLYVLNDDDIPLEKFRQFGLKDLLGEKITGVRKVKNPKEYDSSRESPNPEYFDLVEFESGGFLLTEEEGWQDGTTLHCFYYDGRSVRYTDRLFSD